MTTLTIDILKTGLARMFMLVDEDNVFLYSVVAEYCDQHAEELLALSEREDNALGDHLTHVIAVAQAQLKMSGMYGN